MTLIIIHISKGYCFLLEHLDFCPFGSFYPFCFFMCELWLINAIFQEIFLSFFSFIW